MCGEPAQLHFTLMMAAQLHLTPVMAVAQIEKRGDGVHTRRGVHGVLVLTMMVV